VKRKKNVGVGGRGEKKKCQKTGLSVDQNQGTPKKKRSGSLGGRITEGKKLSKSGQSLKKKIACEGRVPEKKWEKKTRWKGEGNGKKFSFSKKNTPLAGGGRLLRRPLTKREGKKS